jgi:hypothetical protein
VCEITNCYSAGGGITGAASGLGCIITNCVCNGGPLAGISSDIITLGSSSTVLNIIDKAIYTNWLPSIWLIGNPATVTVNSVPVDYYLPILSGFRVTPWNSDTYAEATDSAQFGISPPPNTFSGRVNPFLLTGTVLVYTQKAIDTLVANGSGASFAESARVSWAPLGAQAGSLLRDLRRAAVVRVSDTNPLHAYRFQRVQLIRGPTTEGVGGSPTDAWLTGYICVWSASGVAPVFP